MGAPPPSWVLMRSLRKAGRCGDPRTSIANSRFPAPSVAEWRWGILVPLLATECVGEVGFGCYAGSLRWWWACCRGGGAPSTAHDSPWVGHGRHRQRRIYVFPDGNLRPPHMATAGSSQSCHPANALLSPDVRSSQCAEERAAPNQHARASECGKIPTQHALGWYMPKDLG